MLKQPERSGYEDLIRVIRQVRRRWRYRVAIRGAAIAFAVGFLAYAASAYGMDYFRYSEGAVTAFRIFAYLAMAALVVRFLVLLPLVRKVRDEQVALYIEEHDPSLQQAVVSAVEAGKETPVGRIPTAISPALIEKLVESAVERCGAVDYGRGIERSRIARASGILTAFALAGMVVVTLGPGFLRYGGSLLLKPWRSARAASPYSIAVEPGNLAVARGADQMIQARLGGFDSDHVEVSVKFGDGDAWQRWPMTMDEQSGAFAFMLFDLQATAHYYVDAAGVRSDMYRLDVTDLPFVQRIDLEYFFPPYTGLDPQRVEDGGDIAALQGTRVSLLVTPTVQVAGGRILVEGAEPIPLVPNEGSGLVGEIVVDREGFYKIELLAFDGKMYKSSPDYTIDVLTDQRPMVTITKPGRDTKVTSIEEVFTEVEAQDDYGVAKLELIYSVNGGDEKTVTLFDSDTSRKKELSAGHTFFLEDFELQPGDFLSYFARAADSHRPKDERTATTDIYFVEVRPFGKDYRQAQQGMGGGAGGGADGTLSLRQRQIVAATFKLVRDKNEYTPREYTENLTTIALMQGRLREQVENLLRRMTNRGITEQESDLGKISESLRLASQEMVPAEERLTEGKPEEALPPEQRALQHLQRAESVFRDVQVAFGGGAGGGGGEQANAEDLADLFELELDKLRNQYETVERGERESTDNQIDEALQRLQELARRQQQENERMKRRGGPNAQGGRGGASQEDLADEAEELARKLERLSREQSQPDLMESARRLRQAADSMRRGTASGSQGALSEGIAALDELKEARRLLEKNQSARLEEDMKDVQSRAERLASQQDKILSDVRKMGEEDPNPSDRLQRLLERKDEMAAEVADLESQLDRMARESRSDQKDASRKLQEAANSIRESKIKEKLRYSKGVVQGRSPEYAERFEEQVEGDIDNLRGKIQEAADSFGKSEETQVADAIDRTRDLVRNLESLGERVREKQDEARRLGEDRGGQEDSNESAEPTEEGGEPSRTEGSAGGAPAGAGSQDGRFQPGTFRTEDLRQWRREFQERMKEAEQLRRELTRQDLQVPDLQSIIERMRAFDSNQIYLDPLGFDELQSALVEELKQFEYWLRRELEGIGKEKLFLAGSDQVPSEYRSLVEEYYRSLSRQPSKKR